MQQYIYSPAGVLWDKTYEQSQSANRNHMGNNMLDPSLDVETWDGEIWRTFPSNPDS